MFSHFSMATGRVSTNLRLFPRHGGLLGLGADPDLVDGGEDALHDAHAGVGTAQVLLGSVMRSMEGDFVGFSWEFYDVLMGFCMVMSHGNFMAV